MPSVLLSQTFHKVHNNHLIKKRYSGFITGSDAIGCDIYFPACSVTNTHSLLPPIALWFCSHFKATQSKWLLFSTQMDSIIRLSVLVLSIIIHRYKQHPCFHVSSTSEYINYYFMLRSFSIYYPMLTNLVKVFTKKID